MTLPERGPLNIRLDVATTINTTAEEARRKVSVETGELQITDELIEELEENAQRFAAGAAL